MHTKSLLSLLLVFSAALPAAAADVSIGAEIRLGRALPPPPPEIIVVDGHPGKGPPPWAPAHGFRRKHGYYYYPGASVYFRPADRMWFYLEGGRWRAGAQLPASVQIDFHRSVPLTMATSRPYDHHRHVADHYPQNYFSTVKLKESPGRQEHAAQANGRGRASERELGADDSPGRGKGHGKGKGKGRN